MEDRTTLRAGFQNGTVEMSDGWDMVATSVAEETLPWQPGLAMVHFRVAGSEVSDRVAAILAQIVEAHAGRLPLTEVDVDDRPQLAARYNVRATPSVLLLRDGSVVDRVIGDASRTLVQSLLDARAAESWCRARSTREAPRMRTVWRRLHTS
jgi:Thioredoxin